jgi:histidinol phosphatase-like PHP family hydrolase
MILVNDPNREDYHMHTSTFSDGENTAEEIVGVAGEIGLIKIAITDHSRMILDSYIRNWKVDMEPKENRDKFKERWQRTHENGVEVIVGLEADLLDGEGNICDFNWDPRFKEDWLILSAHAYGYHGEESKVMQGYLKAIQKYGERIKIIGHPYCSRDFPLDTNMRELAKAANDHGIAGEINGKCFGKPEKPRSNIADYDLLNEMLEYFDRIVINSDAHSLNSLRHGRKQGTAYFNQQLEQQKLIEDVQRRIRAK